MIVDIFMKPAHFIRVRTTYSTKQYAHTYIEEFERLHGVPVSFIFDRGSEFTSRFWWSLLEALSTKLHFSIAFQPQTDGQYERIIRTLEDMLRA